MNEGNVDSNTDVNSSPPESPVDVGDVSVAKEVKTDAVLPADRQTLVDTAVKFLQNPKVIPTAIENKKSFLRKKGLTEAEIEIAIKKSGTSESQQSLVVSQNQIRTADQMLVPNRELAIAPVKPVQKLSFWTTVFKWIKNFLFAGCIAFTAYKLIVKKHFSGAAKKKAADNDKIIRANEQLQKSVQEMRTSLSSLKETVELMNNVVTQFVAQKSIIGASDESAIKNEVQSIKNLLLSRSQFPSLPTVNPVIPSWQLENKATSKPKSPNDDPVIISSSDVSTNGTDEAKKSQEAN